MKHIKMPKVLAEKWLHDLRSGEYKQGKGKLYKGGRYCCLGVLIKSAGCEVSEEVACDGSLALPSLDWLTSRGITFMNSVGQGGRVTPFISAASKAVDTLNDDGAPFSKIADLLEEEIEYTDNPTTE